MAQIAVVPLSCDTSGLRADLALLAQAAERSLEVRQRLLDLGDLSAHIRCVDLKPHLALAACQVRIRLEFSDRVAALVAALRAGDGNGLAVQH